MSHAVRLVPLGLVIGEQKGHAQARNIERGSVITGSVPHARGIATTQPGSPIAGLLAISQSRGKIGFCRLVTMGTGVRGAASFYLARADPEQMAFVFEHPPHLPAHGGIVGPVAAPPAHASATSLG